jgi:hypothetical protein
VCERGGGEIAEFALLVRTLDPQVQRSVLHMITRMRSAPVPLLAKGHCSPPSLALYASIRAGQAMQPTTVRAPLQIRAQDCAHSLSMCCLQFLTHKQTSECKKRQKMRSNPGLYFRGSADIVARTAPLAAYFVLHAQSWNSLANRFAPRLSVRGSSPQSQFHGAISSPDERGIFFQASGSWKQQRCALCSQARCGQHQ